MARKIVSEKKSWPSFLANYALGGEAVIFGLLGVKNHFGDG
jgi:hypothetical protein